MNKNDTIIAYHDFAEWCRDNPHLDLDSRPHSHGGPIGYGGYISDEKTRAAFAAWRAAIEADRKRISDLEAQLEKALTERDDYHDIADQLAEQIAAITNQEIGEHSSGNNPWQNAMLAADEWIAKDIRRLTDGVDRKRRGEPVMYQVRTRPDWNEQWCRWEECTREQAEDYRKAPVLHDLHYEVRELYTAPQPAPDVSALVEALDSRLSIARFCGGLSYQGHRYVIAYDEEGQPLVRLDVLTRERKERKAAQKAAREAEKQDAAERQKELL